MRAVVVANCQARPVSSFLKMLTKSLDPIEVVVVHLRTDTHGPEDYASLEAADIIFAQFVTDQYLAGHLATSRLKEKFGGKVVSWPNIFFRGQTPDLAYVSVQRPGAAARQRLLGPLREYHHRGVIEAWQQGLSVEDTIALLDRPSLAHHERILAVTQSSIEELRRREGTLDTKISDMIEAKWQDERLFFSFNHPSASLLAEMARRLLTQAGLDNTTEIATGNEPLDLVIPPSFGRDHAVLGKALGDVTVIKGAVFSMTDGKPANGAIKLYTPEDFIAASFDAYASQLSRDDVLAFSPP